MTHADANSCSRCGRSYPPDAPPGLCPHCALGCALEIESENLTFDPLDETVLPSSAPSPFLPNPPTNQPFGDYQILEEIARGGMGIVYRAYQTSLKRIVAIKLLPFSALTTSEQIKRFRAEASAAAALHHPNIVSVHEVGFLQGQHYLVMNLVQGPSLTHLLTKGPLPSKKAAVYMRTIAQAVHYAHENNILHRDLKPSNVLLDQNDQPQVTDFGLAKRLDDDSNLTITGQALGSPSYMPPEQALADHKNVSRRSDVYGLGAILYHMITGNAPFQASTINQTIHQVLERAPLSPNLLNPSVPKDLQIVCLKCLEKEPNRRYQNAKEMAEDLTRFLNGESIQARPIGFLENSWRGCRRRPILAGLSLALLMTTLAGLSGIIWQWRRAVAAEKTAYHDRDRAFDAELRADRDRNVAQKFAAEALLEKGQTKLQQGDTSGLLDFVEAYRLAIHHPEFRIIIARRWAFWHSEWTRRILATRPCSEVISPNAQMFSEITPSRTGTSSSTVRILDLLTGSLVTSPLEHSFALVSTRFSPDNRLLATLTEKGILHLWSLETGRLIRPPLETGVPQLNTILFSNDGSSLVCFTKIHLGPPSNQAAFLSLDTDQSEIQILEHRHPVGGARISPDGRTLAILCKPDLQLWNTKTLQPISPPIMVTSTDLLDINHLGTQIAVNRAGMNGFSLLNPKSGQILQEFPMESEDTDLIQAGFSHDGQKMVSIGWDRSLKFWNIQNPSRPFATHPMREKAQGNLSFNPEDTLLAFGDAMGKVRVFDGQTGELLHTLHTQPNSEASFLANGMLLTHSDTHATFWDLHATPFSNDTLEEDSLVTSMAFDPSGEWLALGSHHEIRIWRMGKIPSLEGIVPVTGQVLALNATRQSESFISFDDRGHIQAITPRSGTVREIRKIDHGYHQKAWFSPDARKLAIYSYLNALVVDFASGNLITLPSTNGTQTIRFSPDSTKVVQSLANSNVRIFDALANSTLMVNKLSNLGGWVLDVAYHPDGKRLAVNIEGRAIRLYDPNRKKIALGACETSLHKVDLMRFSPDGTLLATAGPKTNGGFGIELWHVDSSSKLIRSTSILPSPHPIWSLEFSPTEPKLVSGGLGSTRIWHLPPTPENQVTLEELTQSTLGLQLNQQEIADSITPSPESSSAILARLVKRSEPNLSPLETALLSAPQEALSGIQTLSVPASVSPIFSLQQALLHIDLMHTLATKGLLKEALEHVSNAIELGLTDPETQNYHAFLSWYAGDEGAYRNRCRSMVENFSTTNDPVMIRFLAYAVSLEPGALKNYSDLIAQLKRALERLSPHQVPPFRYFLGCVLFRAGYFAEADLEFEQVDQFLKSNIQLVNFDPTIFRFHYALCKAHLGDYEAAHYWFNMAQNDVMELLHNNPNATRSDWWFFPLVKRLREETESVLRDFPSQPSPL